LVGRDVGVVGEAADTKHLHGGCFVQDVIVVGSVEQIDDGAKCAGVLGVELIGHTVLVDLSTCTAVEVGNLKYKVGRSEEDFGQGGHTEVLDLAVGNLDALPAVSFNTTSVRHERIVLGSVELEVCPCK